MGPYLLSPPGPTVSFSSLAEPRADLWTLQATVIKAPLVYCSPTEQGLGPMAVGSVTKHAPALNGHRGEASSCLQDAYRVMLSPMAVGSEAKLAPALNGHRGEASSCLREP